MKTIKARITREQLKEIAQIAERNKILPNKDGKYDVRDLLTAPFSETFKEILMRVHSKEDVDKFEKYIKERNENN